MHGLPTLGITLPQFSERPEPALAAARDARRLGFGGVFVFDHLWPLGGPGPGRPWSAGRCWPPWPPRRGSGPSGWARW